MPETKPLLFGWVLFLISWSFLAAAPAAPKEGIQWETSLDEALQNAAAVEMPVFIAVSMDGEAVCEELANDHYRDARIVDLSRHMICLFASKYFHCGGKNPCPMAGSITCVDHQHVEREVREKVMKIKDDREMPAPNHLFLGPDGKLLFSVSYMITKGELEWCMWEAIRKSDPDFSWRLGNGARAPRRIVYGGIARPDGGGGKKGGGRAGRGKNRARPLSGEELEEVLDALKKSDKKDRFRMAKDYFPSLILSTDKRAMDMVRNWLFDKWVLNRGRTPRLIHDIGRTSPEVYWELVAPFVSNSRLEIRNEAIVALEQFAEPKSLKYLMKQRSSEKEKSAQGNLYRAIASVGRGKSSAESIVLKAAEKGKDAFLRTHAVIGLVYVENREKVNDVLVKALSAKDPGVRAAAAYTIAVRREHELLEALDVALDLERDARCRTYLDKARAALKGGDLHVIQGVLNEFAQDRISRDREL